MYECPYCKNPMRAGELLPGKGPLKWYPHDGETFLGVFNLESERVGDEGFFLRPRLTGYRCEHCQVLILNTHS